MPSLARIPIDQAIAGMMLAEDVCAAGGGLLLPAGTTLSQEQIARLIQRGISELGVVAPVSEGVADAEREAQRVAERHRVLHIFRHAGNDALTQALIKAVLEYRLERIR